MIPPGAPLALLMHDYLVPKPGQPSFGKMGLGLLRYSPNPIAAVMDETQSGRDLAALTGIARAAPIVASVAAAHAAGAEVLVIGVATAGGVLPARFRADIVEGLRAGMSLVNGLHVVLNDDPELAALVRPGAFIWDVRREPPDLMPGTGAAAALAARRVLTVGTDMAIGKMTASIELDRAARARGLRSAFLASGQIGMCISGSGIALDAVRVDFAAGAVEQMVMAHAADHDVLWIEGQGSILHPASTAWLPLMRGSCPTHLVLCHRAGQTRIARAPVRMPALRDVADLYERVASVGGVTPGPRVVGIALNCGHLDDAAAAQAVAATEAHTGLPTVDVVRTGAGRLLDAVLAP
jgi:uncharacterized NAD-dependent epimerase/dehydratase family protein